MMPEIINPLIALNEARRQHAAERQTLEQLQRRVNELQRGLNFTERFFNPRDPTQVARRQRLLQELQTAKQAVNQQRTVVASAKAREDALFDQWIATQPPQVQITQLNDAFPILLLPVRLETRFKANPRLATRPYELWVRVYPDDCAIDSFEPMLTQGEVQNTQHYWCEHWRAGGVEGQERAAWRGLVASYGAGRALWLVQQVRPLNLADKPSKAKPDDMVLVIPTATALAANELPAVSAYWRAVWLAGKDEPADAWAALVAALGAARAQVIRLSYPPFNLADEPAAPLTRAEVTVTVVQLLLPAADAIPTKAHAWSEAAKVNVLPERFVLLGYAGNHNTPTIQQVGARIPSPLVVGPNPAADDDDQIKAANGDITVGEELRWMVDFDEAVKRGMGFKVALTEAQYNQGFDRLLVVGVQMSGDEQSGQQAIETLFSHQRYTGAGFSLVPQGTPTNNTEQAGAGFSTTDEPDPVFDDNFQQPALFTDSTDWLQKRDGQRLAELLGLDKALFKTTQHSGGADQAEAQAMNVALWPATLGYMLDTMLEPLLDDGDIASVRWFFTRFVSGRGALPAIRMGRQPYGILPTTAFSRLKWLRNEQTPVIRALPESSQHGKALTRIYEVTRLMATDWQQMGNKVAYVGQPGNDPQATLLDILGLHPTSAEFHQRYAQSIEHIENLISIANNLPDDEGQKLIERAEKAMELNHLLVKLGMSGNDEPDILKKFFNDEPYQLHGSLIDDRPLSEREPIRPYTADGKNYIQWLREAAGRSLDDVRLQRGFKDNAPNALLYLLLRHALMLSYWESSLQLHQNKRVLTAQAVKAERRELPFIHVADQPAQVSESRWRLLYTADALVTGNATQRIADYIPSLIGRHQATARLVEELRALDLLQTLPTARLARLFAEHIDCCSYRLDAWQLGLVHYQLATMRYAEASGATPKRGLHVGAFGWLENVRRENKSLQPMPLDPERNAIFNRPGESPALSDPSNGGYIHAPSLNQAVTAAILRNGYLANATPANHQSLAVNLSSARVRAALSILEGMRNGQSLGALLGYQLERGLHDRHKVAELDQFILKLRRAFPLRADRHKSTQGGPDVSIEALEARNVIDGLRLINRIKSPDQIQDLFDKTLPNTTGEQQNAISAEVKRLFDIHDAVADLLLAEGVHQASQGNYDRAAATLDAYGKGQLPPEPSIIETPRSGVTLTQRVGLHLMAGLDSTTSPLAGIAMTPRAGAEPALNGWLATVLPPPTQVGCRVRYRNPVDGLQVEVVVTQAHLQLQPIDLLYLLHTENQQAMSELDDRVLRYVRTSSNLRPDVTITIHYTERLPGLITLLELAPLIKSLRGLLLRSRPLRASDVLLESQAGQTDDETLQLDSQRIIRVRDGLAALQGDLTAFQAGSLDQFDATVTAFVNLLARAASFGLPQAGWGSVYEEQRQIFARVLEQITTLTTRWGERLTTFDDLLATYDALPAETTDDLRVELLQQAEFQIATQLTSPIPTNPASYRMLLTNRGHEFITQLNGFAAIKQRAILSLSTLRTSLAALLPISAFDGQAFTLGELERQMLTLLADLAEMARRVANEAARRITTATAQIEQASSVASAAERVALLQQAAKTLLGDDFVVIPEFQLATEQGQEWEQAFQASQSGELLRHVSQRRDFPVDDWLYGLARVREKLHQWEESMVLTNAFGQRDLTLLPMQLPYTPQDHWLALEFPAETNLNGDRLLYTAHYASPFDKSKPQCGLLLDEWTEVIPAREVTTGVAFHYDRPNTEAPQVMLLVTPTEFTGAWKWADLVDALHETLDMARQRAVEPAHIDATAYARLLPATVMTATRPLITIATNLAMNNNILAYLKDFHE